MGPDPAAEPDGPDPGPGPLPAGLHREALVAEVRRALQVVPDGAAAVVALSGGPDSTALAYLTAEARADLDLHLAHVRHGLRDDTGDVAVVRRHADYLGLDLHVERVRVRRDGAGLEAAARRARYGALRRVAAGVGAAWILVGHTADDQAETVLLRLARGTGVRGLGAMAPVRDDLVRPLLRLRRADVRAFVAGEGLPSVADPMNEDPAVTRVRARQEALPAMGRLGADPVGALARLADLARGDARLLARQAGGIADRLVRRVGPFAIVPRGELAVLPGPLAARVVRRVVEDMRGTDAPLTAAHTRRLLELEPGGAVDLPGLRATAGGGWLAIGPADTDAPPPRELPVPGRVVWSPLGMAVVATTGAPRPDPRQPPLPFDDPWTAVAAATAALPPGTDPGLARVVLGRPADGGDRALWVRSRRPGDRVATGAGTRKLKDVMIDAGVPRLVRHLIPVVTTGETVLWVPGLAVDDEAVVRGRARPWAALAVTAAATGDR